jgi:hypothetical protein
MQFLSLVSFDLISLVGNECNQAFTIDKIRKTTNKKGINCLMIPNILQNSRRDTAKSLKNRL